MIVKKCLTLVLICLCMVLMTGCSMIPHEHIYGIEVSETPSTCVVKGEKVLKCNQCEETIIEELSLSSHTVKDWKVVKQATVSEWGSQEGMCIICHEAVTKLISKIGSSPFSPLEIDTKKFYKDICNGKFNEYQGLYLKLSGKVTHVSDYGDMIGYYLQGEIGEGVCCWVYSWQTKKRLANVGDVVTFVGKVESEGSNHVELVMCELVKE